MMTQPANVNQIVETVIRDVAGTPIFQCNSHEYTVFEPSGAVSIRKISDNMVLEDDVVWNPAMLAGRRPVRVVVCAVCRRPSRRGLRLVAGSHGLCTEANASRCATCRRMLCPKHTCRCADDEARCPTCARSFKHRLWLKSVFFERVES